MSVTTQEEPALLIKARKRLADLHRAIGDGGYETVTARRAAAELSELIDWTLANEIPILRGSSPHLSSLAFWLSGWGEFINHETAADSWGMVV